MTTTMKYHTPQEEAGPPYLKDVRSREVNSRGSGAKLFNREEEGQEDCEKIAKIESRRVGRVCVCVSGKPTFLFKFYCPLFEFISNFA
jgi:hypothetical protein